MGVSFKVARAGTRYRPKPGLSDDNPEGDNGGDSVQGLHEGNYGRKGDKVADQTNESVKSGVQVCFIADLEVSFSLNLFPNGFSVGKATELFTDVPKQLRPYDRASETIFTAIEYGWLPGDVFDGLSCKYVNGALLCEIRDYRNCLFNRAGSASAVNSPIVHKVSLQMCMENVIKDITSVSNDSWTYKDLLEVESRILKALQPVLYLKPEPLLDRFCREPLTKKLDLGITWSWKRRNSNDAKASNPRFSNQCSKGVPSSQLTISSSVPNLQKNNIVPESIPQPNLLAAEPSYQLAERCSQSVPTYPRLSNLTSVPKQRSNERNHDPGEPSSLVFPEQGTCQIQANKRPLLKLPKEEPLDFSQQHPAVSQPDNTLAAELLKKNTLLHDEAEKNQNERFYDKRSLSLFRNNDQQAISEVNRKMQAGMLASAVKQEPVETSDYLSLNVRNIKDKYSAIHMRSNRSNLQQLQLQQSSSMLGTSIPPANTLRDQMVYDKNARKEAGSQKRKASQNPQVTAGARIAPVSSYQNESLPIEVSLVPAKRKKSSHPKVSSTKLGDSLAVTSNRNTTSHLQLQNRTLPQTSEVKADLLLERFLKVKAVAQRHGLNNRKCKSDKILPKKLDFFNTARIEHHLLDPEENWKSKDATTARISLSECFLDKRLNEAKTRTSIYVHQSHVNQGVQIPKVDGNTHVKLVMSEIFNGGFVEASALYGHKAGIDSTRFHFLPNLKSTYSADRFAAQFTSLMVREGYCLIRDRIESTPLHDDGCSSTQQVTVMCGVTPAAEAFKLPFSTLTPGPSTSMVTPITKSIQAVNCRPLPSLKLLSEGHSLPSGNIQTTQHLSGSNLSKMELDIATQVSPQQQQHWQQNLNKNAHLQFQMMQRHRQAQQNQLIQRMAMAGGLGAAAGGPGMVHYGEGIRGHANIGPGSLSNVMSTGGSIEVPRGGQIPWNCNGSQFNNIGSNVPSSSDSRQFFSGTSDNEVQVLATMTTADSQGRALMGGYSFQRNASNMPLPMQTPSIQDMGYLLSNQQILPQNQQMPGTPQLLQPKVETSLLDDYIGNTSIVPMNHSLSQVSSQLFDQFPQMNHLQASSGSGSVILRMNNRNVVFSPGSPVQSSRTRGSVASHSLSSSRTLSGLSKKMGVVKIEKE
ncbi:hypothetical protein Ddye_030087 [Dipteronia dyeriana]|uniref:Uncharacterized protein n=1 Tax=Dipteronia dyeriana TaxID=168575 RepID=A0AAD9WMC3_9ROSI|nr:hypothetical protein Ddye_030087 [Dipteronia dyeriana]